MTPRDIEPPAGSALSGSNGGRDDERAHNLPAPIPAERSWLGIAPDDSAGAQIGLTPPDGSDSQLSKYWRVLRERWQVAFATFVIVFLGAAVGGALRTPMYSATGTIEIRKQAAEVVPVDAIFQLERISEQYLETQYGLLRSPALVTRALSDTAFVPQLFAHGLLPAEMPRDSLRAALADLATNVQKRLAVEPVTGSRLVKVRFEAEQPWLAAAVVNTLLRHFIVMREEAAAAAASRLGQQADSVRAHVVRAEEEVREFVRSNGLTAIVTASSQTENTNQQRLRILEQELTAAETETYKTEALYESSAQGKPAVESDLMANLRARRAQLQSEYARLRSTFTDSYPQTLQAKSELDELDRLIAREERRISASIGNQLNVNERRRESLLAAIEEQRALLDSVSEKVAEYERRRRDLEAHQQLYAALQQKRKEAAVSAALASMDVAIPDPAVPSELPVRPNPRRDLPLAAMLGLLLAVGVAFLRDYTDTSVRSAAEVSGLAAAPILGLIPSVRPRFDRARTVLSIAGIKPEAHPPWYRIDQQDAMHEALVEAFSGLRTSMLFNAADSLPRSILVTSAAPGEGKTTVATNLAISLATLGRRVLIIDADIRRSSVHRVFGVSAEAGLTNYLTGELSWQAAVQQNAVPRLDIMTAGGVRPEVAGMATSPVDLLSGDGVSRLVEAAKLEYDFVILDAPALFINASDTRILALCVDGVVAVVRSGSTPREVLRPMLGQIPNLLGVVVNELDLRRLPAYYREYGAVEANAGAEPRRPIGVG